MCWKARLGSARTRQRPEALENPFIKQKDTKGSPLAESRGSAVGLACLLVILSGCLATPATHPPIPAIPDEQVPVPPPAATELIWQPGHFDWDGAHYTWVRGEWTKRSGPNTLWRDGFWDMVHKQPVWVPAGWV